MTFGQVDGKGMSEVRCARGHHIGADTMKAEIRVEGLGPTVLKVAAVALLAAGYVCLRGRGPQQAPMVAVDDGLKWVFHWPNQDIATRFGKYVAGHMKQRG